MKIILLRHGESEWNLQNRFTGWTDVDLTKNGIKEAEFSGEQILTNEIKIDMIYTSILKRAKHTAKIVAKTIGFNIEKINYDWRLNERHYGALQGLNKSETASKFGEEQVKVWRRSYDIPPPLLPEDDKRHPKFEKKFDNINNELPIGESLKNVVDRLIPFWQSFINHVKNNPANYLIVAHSNSLRAIVKILEDLSDEKIIEVDIPTGVPLVYTLNQNFNVLKKKYLIDDDKLKKKKEIVANQGKAK